jgi:hypothetical protein
MRNTARFGLRSRLELGQTGGVRTFLFLQYNVYKKAAPPRVRERVRSERHIGNCYRQDNESGDDCELPAARMGPDTDQETHEYRHR